MNSPGYSRASPSTTTPTTTSATGEQSSETETTHYITNGLNQYVDINGDKPDYDLDGNQTNVRTSTGNWRISYNDQGRPEHITSEDGSTQVQCTYDHMGRRVRKTVSRQGRVVKDHTFAYRDYLQVAVFDILNNGAPVHTILWDLSQPIATRPLCITTADGQTHYYGWDLNKNVTELFDEAGKLAATYDYTPYGELLNQPAEGIGKDNPFRYSSEYHDEELGLIYYNYRHYNPTSGRWISRDPIHEQGGWNLYGFVKNQSVNKVDLLGLQQGQNQPSAKDIIKLVKNPNSVVKTFGSKEKDFTYAVCTKDPSLIDSAIIASNAQILSNTPSDFNPSAYCGECQCIKRLVVIGHGSSSSDGEAVSIDWGDQVLDEDSTETSISDQFSGQKFCPECTIELRSCQLGLSKYLKDRISTSTGCNVTLHCSDVNPWTGLSREETTQNLKEMLEAIQYLPAHFDRTIEKMWDNIWN